MILNNINALFDLITSQDDEARPHPILGKSVRSVKCREFNILAVKCGILNVLLLNSHF